MSARPGPERREARRQNNRGVALQAAGRAAEALRAYRLASTADSELPEPFANAARLLLRMGRPERAVTAAELALTLAPDHPVAGPVREIADALVDGTGPAPETTRSFEPGEIALVVLNTARRGRMPPALRTLTAAMRAWGPEPVLLWTGFCLARVDARDEVARELARVIETRVGAEGGAIDLRPLLAPDPPGEETFLDALRECREACRDRSPSRLTVIGRAARTAPP